MLLLCCNLAMVLLCCDVFDKMLLFSDADAILQLCHYASRANFADKLLNCMLCFVLINSVLLNLLYVWS